MLRYFAMLALLPLLMAADAPAKPEKFTFRVLGLYAPEREADLKAGLAEIPDVKLIDLNYADAEITVEFVPKTAFPGAKPEQLPERFEQKLRQATHHTFGVRPKRNESKEKLEEVTISAGACDCRGCRLAVSEAVDRLDGVDRVFVDLKAGQVKVRIDPEKVDRAKLEDALRKKGVKVPKG